MMEKLNPLVSVLFILTTLLTVGLLYQSFRSWKLMVVVAGWMVVTAILALSGFLLDFEARPPRFTFVIPVAVIAVLVYSFSKAGRKLISHADLRWLTLLHAVRIPVEIGLYLLFVAGLVPNLMTFEGFNWDIISGITALIVYLLYFVVRKMPKRWLLVWNVLCLGLLVNIVTIALLSAKTPLQQLAFDQPNVGVAYFPFVWLPTIIVPAVLFAHVASIQKLR